MKKAAEAPAEDFITAYTRWDRAVISDAPTASVVFDSFCLFMEHQLLNEQKPVNLGFAKISAVMARKTWDLVVFHKYNCEYLRRRRVNRAGVKFQPMEEYLCESLAKENVTAWDEEKGIFRWTLNIVPTESFTLNCESLEAARKEKSGGLSQYVLSGQDQLKRQIPALYEAFIHFLKEARHPILVLPQSADRSSPLFTGKRRYRTGPKGAKKTHWTAALRPAPNLSGNPVVLGRSMDLGTAQVVATENEGVQSMSYLEQRKKDLRDTGQNMDESKDGSDGDAWLRVLHAVEGEAGRSVLVKPRDSRSDGLEHRVESAAEETKT